MDGRVVVVVVDVVVVVVAVIFVVAHGHNLAHWWPQARPKHSHNRSYSTLVLLYGIVVNSLTIKRVLYSWPDLRKIERTIYL